MRLQVRSRPNSRRCSPSQTLQDLKARARAGLSMAKHVVRDSGLFDRAVRDFGNWSSALVAAGLLPEDHAYPAQAQPVTQQVLSEKLLRSPLSNRAIEKMTGVDRRTIRGMRKERGIVAEQPKPKPELELTAAEKRRVRARLSELDVRAAAILRRRLLAAEPESLRAIGDTWGISRQRVRRIEIEALEALLGPR